MNRLRRTAVAGTFLLVLAGVAVLFYHHHYPYGARPACLPVLLEALRSYSLENGGAFPDSRTEPLEALRMLYPKHLPDCQPIAGLSGDRELLKKHIADGSKLDEAASSWVYWPGLRFDDNPDMALIWERKPGLRFNGSRAQGHEVGFIGGYIRQVPDAQWETFLKEQEQMREKAIKDRKDK